MAIRKKRSFSNLIDEYFTDLEEWVEKFGETIIERPSWDLRNCSIEPLREIIVAPAEVLVTVDLPFTDKNAAKVKPVGKNSIEVSAKMRRRIRIGDLGVTHCKGEFQKFHCHVRIPVPVNMNKMDVRYKKGILEVHLPRKH